MKPIDIIRQQLVKQNNEAYQKQRNRHRHRNRLEYSSYEPNELHIKTLRALFPTLDDEGIDQLIQQLGAHVQRREGNSIYFNPAIFKKSYWAG